MLRCCLSFDVEEHHRIEAAAGLTVPESLQHEYARRMEAVTRRLLELLAANGVHATFYIVGTLARTHPHLVRAIADAGHEIGSHSWDHQRIHRLTPDAFRQDVLRSKHALEQVAGQPVFGYRAPTFSVVRQTAWALDILAECGFEYDTSIFPVRHDRYGIPDAPRTAFLAEGYERHILELPPLTYRLGRSNLPVAGGGYFRLFPLAVLQAALRQAARSDPPDLTLAMLYFHPWEFDPTQPRLPLGRLARWRTYVGTRRTLPRLQRLLHGRTFVRAIDAVRAIRQSGQVIPRFPVAVPARPSESAALR